VLGVVTLAFSRVEKASDGSRRALLVLHAAPLTACLGLGVGFCPFTDADGPMAVLVGMLAVAAMATHNALGTLALKGKISKGSNTGYPHRIVSPKGNSSGCKSLASLSSKPSVRS
jgi:hypothetical protein